MLEQVTPSWLILVGQCLAKGYLLWRRMMMVRHLCSCLRMETWILQPLLHTLFYSICFPSGEVVDQLVMCFNGELFTCSIIASQPINFSLGHGLLRLCGTGSILK